MKPRVIDQETTDDLLDAPEARYEPHGKTLLQALAEKGYDVSDLGSLAGQLRQRGHRVPDQPPPTDRR